MIFNRISFKDYINFASALSIEGNSSDENLVVQVKTPSELSSLIDFAIPEDGVAEGVFNDLMEKYLKYSVRTGHSQFFNQLYSGFNLPAFLGDMANGAGGDD